ncbi:MAG: hypothetical protein ACE5QV_09195, partial [Fidelibacterota bacterium]
NVRNYSDFSIALLTVTGSDMLEFEMAWRKYIKKRYKWYLFFDMDLYIWLLLPLIFIVVFIFIKLRNRRIVKRWDDKGEYNGR